MNKHPKISGTANICLHHSSSREKRLSLSPLILCRLVLFSFRLVSRERPVASAAAAEALFLLWETLGQGQLNNTHVTTVTGRKTYLSTVLQSPRLIYAASSRFPFFYRCGDSIFIEGGNIPPILHLNGSQM